MATNYFFNEEEEKKRRRRRYDRERQRNRRMQMRNLFDIDDLNTIDSTEALVTTENNEHKMNALLNNNDDCFSDCVSGQGDFEMDLENYDFNFNGYSDDDVVLNYIDKVIVDDNASRMQMNDGGEHDKSGDADINEHQSLISGELSDSTDDSTDTTSLAIEIAQYICDSNLNKLSSNKLINLLNYVHFQQQPPPQSLTALWNKLNIQFNYEIIKFCTSCMEEIALCNCNRMNEFIHSELIIFPIREEITRVMRKNYEHIIKFKAQLYGKEDEIIKGSIYENQSSNSENPITLILFTDGKPAIKSSKTSIWPVLGSIVEVPKPLRDYQQNLLLLCLWHSPRQPSAEQLFGKIQNELISLLKHGIEINIDGSGLIKFDVFIQAMVADGPGQSKITSMISHNGYYGCRVCELVGSYRARDNTCTYTWSDYTTTNPHFRTFPRFNTCLQEVERLKSIGTKNINVRGLKDISPINYLIFIPTQALYDYFHLCLEGHMKSLLKEWNDIHRGSSLQTCEIISKFDEFFSNISYPHTIYRKLKHFRSYDDWKGTQYRLFLLTLCKFDDKTHVYNVRSFIEMYLKRFSEIYKDSKELLSTHCHIHLWQQVLRHGSLSNTSMFGSESFLHGLYKLAHGTKDIGRQISYWYVISRAVHAQSKEKYSFSVDQGQPINGYMNESIRTHYNEHFYDVFFREFNCTPDNSVAFYSRYKIGFIMYHSLAYSVRKLSSSFNVCVNNNCCAKTICYGKIVFFFFYREKMYLFLSLNPCSLSVNVSSMIEVDQHLSMWRQRINNFFSVVIKSVNTYVILPSSALRSKCFFFPSRNEKLLICTPIDNEIEHD